MAAAIEHTQQLLEQSLAKRMADFESQLSAVKENPNNTKIDTLARDYQEFKSFAIEMMSLLRQQISQLQSTVDNLETRNRGDCLLLKGIPEVPGENISECVVTVIQEKLGISDVSGQSFRACYRLGGGREAGTRSVLVRFWDQRLRQRVWSSKTKFKGTPHSCSEFLIKSRQLLFVEARKIFGMRDCWTQDGYIIVRLPDGVRQKIFHYDDLSALRPSLQRVDPAPQPTESEVQQVPKERHRRAAARRV